MTIVGGAEIDETTQLEDDETLTKVQFFANSFSICCTETVYLHNSTYESNGNLLYGREYSGAAESPCYRSIVPRQHGNILVVR